MPSGCNHTCPVCYGRFGVHDVKTKLLRPCGHTICNGCFEVINQQSNKCPTCKGEIKYNYDIHFTGGEWIESKWNFDLFWRFTASPIAKWLKSFIIVPTNTADDLQLFFVKMVFLFVSYLLFELMRYSYNNNFNMLFMPALCSELIIVNLLIALPTKYEDLKHLNQ